MKNTEEATRALALIEIATEALDRAYYPDDECEEVRSDALGMARQLARIIRKREDANQTARKAKRKPKKPRGHIAPHQEDEAPCGETVSYKEHWWTAFGDDEESLLGMIAVSNLGVCKKCLKIIKKKVGK